jgi:hypothetical protein
MASKWLSVWGVHDAPPAAVVPPESKPYTDARSGLAGRIGEIITTAGQNLPSMARRAINGAWRRIPAERLRLATQALPPDLARQVYPALLLCSVPALPFAREWLRTQRFPSHNYLLTRWLFLRLLGGIYLCAFASLRPQLLGLAGRNGIAPAADFLQEIEASLGAGRYWRVPTLAWIDHSDAFLQRLCQAGIVLSLLLVLGIAPVPVLVALWFCWLSLVNVSSPFLPFQWDVLLQETGFLAIFLAPLQLRPGLLREAPPSLPVIWLFRWLLFRLMFMSGVVKLRSGDATWRGLTALAYHYQTQPLPTPLAWYAHHLPGWFHRLSAAIMFVIEVPVPFLIFGPRAARLLAAALLVWLQLLIMLTGNYAYFNLLSAVLCTLLLDDAALRRAFPAWMRRMLREPALPRRARGYRLGLHLPLAAIILLLSTDQLNAIVLRGARGPRLLRRAQRLRFAGTVLNRIESLRLANRYGLFAVMTTERPEIVVEGSDDGVTWLPYEFRYKPGDVRRAPPWVAPHQPRLDWQMWFAALSSPRANPWFASFIVRLLEGSPDVLALLKTNPFPDAPPRYVRALLYDYQFTERDAAVDGAWWRRELLGVYFPPVSLPRR